MLGLIAVALPAAPFWDGAAHFNFVFGMAPRIVIASLTAFLVGSFLNAYVMSRMNRQATGVISPHVPFGRRWLVRRQTR